MALCGAADGGVAGAVADGIHIDGENGSGTAQPCCGQTGFDACMTGTDDHYIHLLCKKFHNDRLTLL
jgi:hypothetical protein